MDLTQPLKQRIQSIDTLRGLIMIIMTLDHCRDFLHFQGKEYAPTNMATTTVILFFTRWITHYCAPVFVFLSGVSAHLAGLHRSKPELSKFLVTRGLWLILTDVFVITFIFTLNPGYQVIVLEVLWATGFSMILLALLAYRNKIMAEADMLRGFLITTAFSIYSEKQFLTFISELKINFEWI